MATGHREPFIPVDLSEESLFARSPLACRGRLAKPQSTGFQCYQMTPEFGAALYDCVLLIVEAFVRSLAYRWRTAQILYESPQEQFVPCVDWFPRGPRGGPPTAARQEG
jgi:hypothetical protein